LVDFMAGGAAQDLPTLRGGLIYIGDKSLRLLRRMIVPARPPIDQVQLKVGDPGLARELFGRGVHRSVSIISQN
jgi:hypothetical protein